jgi:hypothetical protein
MQKAVAALEKNVEWIAVGLAGLWVLYIVWAFVITKPVAAEIDGAQYSAANVDTAIKRDAADRLSAAINKDYGGLEIVVPEVELVWGVNPPAPLPVAPIESLAPRDMRPQEQLAGSPDNVNGRPIGDKVAQLPEIPAPRIVEVVADKGQVIPPVILQDPNQVGPDGMAVQPLLPPQPMQQQQLPPDAPGAINPQFANAKDAWWVWVTAKFNEGAVQQAFKAAGIPPHLARMEYLAVEVQREELLPDGQWGNAKIIPPLKHNAPPAEFDRQRFPMEYLQWALQQQNQYVILEPPFFQTVGQRKIPLHLQPKVQTFADTTFTQFQSMQDLAMQIESGSMLPTEIRIIEGKLTPEQKTELYRERQVIRQERQRQEALQRQQENQSRQQQRRSTRSMRSGGSYAPIDPELMGEMLASGGGSGGGGIYRDPRMSGYGARGGREIPMPPPMINPVNPNDPTDLNVTRPGGVLTPDGRTSFGEFDVWAYDDTVEPGKSYRYRIRVVMKNPVFKITQAVADAKLAQVMELPADKNAAWSEWSRPVVVERGVDMFLAGVGRNNESVRFDIYRWQDGRVNKQTYTATPGDVLGSLDAKSKVDFNTGYAVVDIRQIANRDFRVTLIDPNGTQVERTYQEDQGNPKRNQLDAEANKPANPALTDLR